MCMKRLCADSHLKNLRLISNFRRSSKKKGSPGKRTRTSWTRTTKMRRRRRRRKRAKSGGRRCKKAAANQLPLYQPPSPPPQPPTSNLQSVRIPKRMNSKSHVCWETGRCSKRSRDDGTELRTHSDFWATIGCKILLVFFPFFFFLIGWNRRRMYFHHLLSPREKQNKTCDLCHSSVLLRISLVFFNACGFKRKPLFLSVGSHFFFSFSISSFQPIFSPYLL